MAASFLSAPGTDYGPCAEPCAHTDCAHTRSMAAVICPFCDEPIGYERRYYNDGEPGGLDLVHAVCLEDDSDYRAQEPTSPSERSAR